MRHVYNYNCNFGNKCFLNLVILQDDLFIVGKLSIIYNQSF